jgi:Fe-S oxidoreductase
LKTGAETVAVACPYCAIMLDDAAGHANRRDVQIVDIAELLASRLTN